MNKKKTLSLLLCAALITTLFGCAKPSVENTAVRIAFFPNITHAQGLIGSAKDSSGSSRFEQALKGCTVEYKSFNAGPAEIEAIFAGEVDIGYIGPVPAINGFVRSGGDVVIISGAANGGAVLVARADANITSVADLAGKKVAVPQLGNTQHLSLLQLLSENGLATTSAGGTVDLYAIENSEIKSMMQSGGIDAALVPEPWGTRLINEVGAKLILDYNQIWLNGNYSTAVVIANKDFLTAHPDLVEKFLQAHADITKYINQNSAEAMATANARIQELTGTALKPEILTEAVSRLVFTNDPARESVEAFIDLSITQGFIDACDNRDALFSLDMINKINTESSK
ncbi:MAG TPA: aliphatic sulfonate ABC transporter substrate-binding protein [Oscillospiraceae bacterium]|nr:aliphatic sulfonate ABC transporter substrate-binding protein [Oscillospiraceae bacterium]HPS33680.1 aliphatic sulfonate ABC transporter substrate-binding protein [Oscillospiraceae bacterium]